MSNSMREKLLTSLHGKPQCTECDLREGMQKLRNDEESRREAEGSGIFYGGCASSPVIEIGPESGNGGNSASRRISIRFDSGQAVENIIYENGGVTFEVVGEWELAELPEALMKLALFLAQRYTP